MKDEISKPEPDIIEEAFEDRRIADQHKAIPGWGYDADPDNDPTYPIKNWNGADHQRFNYEKAQQQPIDVEVLHSTERPGLTRVFGTTLPPSGASGVLRRIAFKYSESDMRHWVLLMMADRVQMVGGMVEDMRKGELFACMNAKMKAEWKYNRKNLIIKAVVSGLAVGLLGAFFLKRRRT